ncbi:MAG: efflux transporter outer membrane subunit [Verrucomicrobiales bacterium]
MKSLISAALASLTLASCTVGPDYEQPSPDLSATYKNTGLSQPAPAGNWWVAFKDAKLNTLLGAAEKNNPDARAALARLDQARAVLGIRRSDLLPSLDANILARRSGDSQNDSFSFGTYNRFESSLNLDYEIDFWGRVRRSVHQQKALTQASAADYQTALLSLRAEVARDYLTLRHLDEEMAQLKGTISLRQENEKLVSARLNEGDATPIDQARAQSQTETVRAELHRLQQRRDELENALAVLTGTNPGVFRLATATPPRTPHIPAGVPGDLLRRRPDIAASERRLAAASEAIGVTIGNYLPRVTLTAGAGLASLESSDLFNKESRLWNIGPSVSLPVITAGRRARDRERAEAAYREALENHRLSVLNAVREVENALSGIKNLDRALAAQEKSAAAAREASRLVRLRYDNGLVSFFEVIDAERQTLAEERALVQTRSARQLVTVQLIQALGGSWK